MINKITFGQFLRQKRIEKGLTQKELSEKLFLSESAISKWEKGKSYPRHNHDTRHLRGAGGFGA